MIEEHEVGGEQEEADDGSEDAQEADHGEVFEEEGLPEGVACAEDDGWEYDGKEEFIAEIDFLSQGLFFGRGTYLEVTAVSMPMKMAMLDSWR